MADDAAKEVNSSNGAEWEVVSLTASAYASSPSPKPAEVIDVCENEVGADKAETSEAMFLSGHFTFPPNQLESLPMELGNVEIQNEQLEVLEVTDNIPLMISDQGGRSDVKDEDNWNLKGLVISDEIYGMSLSDVKVNKLSVHSSNFEDDVTLQGLNLVEKELPSIYSSIVYDDDETEVTPERVDMSEEGQSGGTPFPQKLEHMKDDVDDDDTNGNPELPGDEAWWKRQAISFYSQAKEANAIWSVFLAAAVMGIVILGRHWQHEKWQALQLKWQFSINDEKMGRMLGPISRFKDMIVGGNRCGSFIKGQSSVQCER